MEMAAGKNIKKTTYHAYLMNNTNNTDYNLIDEFVD